MPCEASWWIKRFVLGSVLCVAGSAHSLSLEELQRGPALTPQSFARHFARFKFRFHATVQPPEVFLAQRAGDCDDYATLAATLLKQNGYTPRLISVRMEREVHVVCYIEEARAYLDFNQRDAGDGLVWCGNALPEIARKVAESFGAAWLSVSEFTFKDGQKRLIRSALPRDRDETASTSPRYFWLAASVAVRR